MLRKPERVKLQENNLTRMTTRRTMRGGARKGKER